MIGPSSTDVVVRTIRPWVRRAGRAAVVAAYGLFTMAGALFAPGPSLAFGVLLAVTGSAVVAWLHPASAELPPLPHPAVAGTTSACLPAAIAGTTTLGASAGIVAGLGLVVATTFASHWVTLPPAGSPPPVHASAESVRDEQSLRALLRQLPSDVLLDEWRDAHPESGRSRAEIADGVRLRELLIDEMLRRDPAGTGRWLDAGSDEPPDGQVGGRSV